MSEEKRKATIIITITIEDGRTVERKYSGTNGEIAFILGEFGILCEKESEILNA